MPMLRINAAAQGLCLHGSEQPAHRLFKARSLAAGPALIMVHGYKYSPFVEGRCPHKRLFHKGGWPHALGETSDLRVAFGWHARGGLRSAHTHAVERAAQLAALISHLRGCGPVRIITHSLGATLVLAALPYLRAGDVERIVVLNGAAHLGLAQHALATPCGAQAQLFHITARENQFYDLGFETIISGSGSMARGLRAPNATRIQISDTRTLDGLADLGFAVAPPTRRVCHWSSYTRDGVMRLNAAILDGQVTFDQLRQLHLSSQPATRPNWSLAWRRKTGIMAPPARTKGPLYGQAT